MHDEAGTEIDKLPGDAVFGLSEGSRVLTPEQNAAKERWKEILQIQANLKTVLPDQKFSFVRGDALCQLKPATSARLVMLSTFKEYGREPLMMTQRRPMKRDELPGVLRVSRATVDRTIDDAAGLLTIDTDGAVCLNSDAFCMGKLPKKHPVFHRLFRSSVRHLWANTATSQQKHLGYVFQMLPYLNIQHNVLCWNPWERDPGSIQFMCLPEFAREIGYTGVTNISRLRSIYRDIKLPVNGEWEAFCAVIDVGKTTRIIVNPAVVYAGHSPESIHIQRMICREMARNPDGCSSFLNECWNLTMHRGCGQSGAEPDLQQGSKPIDIAADFALLSSARHF